MSHRSVTLGLVAALALSLAACTPGGTGDPATGGSASPDASEPGGSGPALSECVDGDWTADLDDLVQQLAAHFASSGMTVVSATASGDQELSIAGEGVMGFSADAVLQLALDMGNGLTMTVTQHHTGDMAADWAWDGSAEASDTNGTMIFENFDASRYTVENTVDINGQSSESTIPIPDPSAANVPMVITCTGDTLTTTPQGVPFTTTWRRS
ncbi:hypothetical protein H4J02_04500 [Protaetiibacter sp. SSC-01]|uniref:hypothetical protein n=1 Tax=Protaetiibacter sp. SSC-01 TaxID=2759943 RepID=UPI001656CA37|nr:hypothetical protein [Protaetiibacter sp. SSC-01]QNO38289.1 hypothetical protein H4J02_04500 [Protaetiibacter sp. SSC-01]